MGLQLSLIVFLTFISLMTKEIEQSSMFASHFHKLFFELPFGVFIWYFCLLYEFLASSSTIWPIFSYSTTNQNIF